MKSAIEAVRNRTFGFLAASKIYNVPRSTLCRYFRKDIVTIQKDTLGRKPILTKELENELIEHVRLMEKQFFGLTRRDLCSIAFQLARRHNIPNSFSRLHQSAGQNWLKRFLDRHKDVIRKRKRTEACVEEFFNQLEKVVGERNLSASQIYTADECNKLPVTVLMCMNALGHFLPPMIVFPAKNPHELLKKGAPSGSIFKFHPNGSIQPDTFTAWFNHFLKAVKPSKNNPVLLLLNGNKSYTRNLDVVIKANENSVSILSFPPRAYRKIQPLHRSVMGTLKTIYNEEAKHFSKINHQRAVTHFDFCEIFNRAYTRMRNGKQGFVVTGLYPVRRDVFIKEFYLGELERVEEQEATDDDY